MQLMPATGFGPASGTELLELEPPLELPPRVELLLADVEGLELTPPEDDPELLPPEEVDPELLPLEVEPELEPVVVAAESLLEPELLLPEVVPDPEELVVPEAAVEVAVEPTELARLEPVLCDPPELPPGDRQSAPGKLPPSQPTRAKPS
jgi:hypothetical protein